MRIDVVTSLFSSGVLVVSILSLHAAVGLALTEEELLNATSRHPRCLASSNCSCFCGKSATFDDFIKKSATVKGSNGTDGVPWWRTCAVVGSSGLLIKETLGEVIDSNDAIFRANVAPSEGFERFVGSRTTVRVGSFLMKGDEMQVRKRRGKGCHRFMAVFGNTTDIPQLEISDVAAIDCLTAKVPLDLPENAPKITTGMLAIAMALHVCESVSLFGFDTHKQYLKMSEAIRNNHKLPYPYHYFDKKHPGHEFRGFKNDSSNNVVVQSTHDIFAEHTWRERFYHSESCRRRPHQSVDGGDNGENDEEEEAVSEDRESASKFSLSSMLLPSFLFFSRGPEKAVSEEEKEKQRSIADVVATQAGYSSLI